MHASLVEAVSLKISDAAGAGCSVECMRHHWKQFRCRFLRPEGFFALSNPCVTHGSSFVDDFRVASDSVSLMISKPTWDVCSVECMHHPRSSFVDDF
jgi:hypothetical protein